MDPETNEVGDELPVPGVMNLTREEEALFVQMPDGMLNRRKNRINPMPLVFDSITSARKLYQQIQVRRRRRVVVGWVGGG